VDKENKFDPIEIGPVSFWFPTAIYRVDNIFDQDQNKKWSQLILDTSQNIQSGGKFWLGNTFTSLNGSYDLKNDKEFESLITTVLNHVQIFAETFESYEDYICDAAWFNINYANTFQEFHLHENSIFSAVYWVNVPDNSGHLRFQDPRPPDMLTVKNGKKTSPLTFDQIIATPKTGSLVIFRSNLRHCVTVCKNVDPRISIAFNFL